MSPLLVHAAALMHPSALPCSFANKQDGASVLSDQDLSDRLALEQLINEAGIDQCQVVSVLTYLCTYCAMTSTCECEWVTMS